MEINAEQAPRFCRGCVPSPNPTCSPDAAMGPSSSSGLALCHHRHSEELRVPGAPQQSCLLCGDTRLQRWQAAASSLHLTAGCLLGLCMKEQGCIEQKRGPSLLPIHGTAPKCLHPTVVPQAQEGLRDLSSAQSSWAESPARFAQTSQIHNI